MSSDVPAPARGRPPSGAAGVGAPALLFALLGGQSAYAVHLVASFWAVPLACRAGTSLPLHAITAVTLATAVAATVVSVRWWRRLSPAVRTPGRGVAPEAVPGPAVADTPHGGRPARRGYLAAVLLRRRRLATALLAAAAATRPATAPTPPRGAPAARSRGVFMAGTGILLNGLGVALIVFHGAAVFFVEACT